MRYPIVISALLACLCCFAENSLQNKMLSYVEKIVIVDSINVDKYAFFRNYRLQPSAGTILSGEEIATQLEGVVFPSDFVGSLFTGFTNEFNDYLVWAQEDTTGYIRLAESVRLGDGSWSTPAFIPSILNNGVEADDNEEEGSPIANAAFPFMLDDGQTLYFAADNEHSIGGYDIFIASKDPTDGEFLLPGNMGMPFNSPYDDYMMAIDRQTGVGWWATDRNQLEDKITIYVYVLTDERTNVDPDDEFLMNYATLSGWQDLMDPETIETVKKFREEINKISPTEPRDPEFTFQMPKGKTYHFFSDFKNQKAASLMQSYLRDKYALNNKKKELAQLRVDFHNGDSKTAARIQILEDEIRVDELSLRALLSAVYQAELDT